MSVPGLPALEPASRPVRHLLVAVLALGLAVRLAHLVAIAGTAFPEIPTVFRDSDMHATWEWAQTILAGDALGRHTYHPETEWMQAIAPMETWYRWWGGRAIFQQAPLYAYFMAGALALTRGSLAGVLVLQLVLGAAEPLVVFALARRLFGAAAGLFAAALMACHGPLIFYQGSHLRDWIPPLLEPLALVLVLRAEASGRGRRWALAGAVIGVAFLGRETAPLLAAATLGWLWWRMRARPRLALHATAWLLGGLLLAVSPLVVRNLLVGAPALAASNRAAEGVILGQAADTSPVGGVIPPSMGPILRRTDGRLAAVVVETLETWRGHGWAFVRFQGTKIRALLDPLEVPDNFSVAYGAEISPVLALLPGHALLLPLGLAGLLLSLGRWRQHLLLLLATLGATGGVLLSLVLARYRLTLVPALAVFAGAGLGRLAGWLAARRISAIALYVGLVVGVALVQQLVVPLDSVRQEPAFVVHYPSYHYAALVYRSRGRLDRSVAELARFRILVEARRGRNARFAAAADDASMEEGDERAMWAARLIAEGRRDEARHQVELAAERYAVRPRVSGAHYNLGLLYLRLGESARARDALDSFLALEPAGRRAEHARRLLDGLPRT